MLTVIPFTGFYNSEHAEALEQYLENERDYLNCVNQEALETYIEFFNDSIDWQKAQESYARIYVDRWCEYFEDRTGIALACEYESMDSPRFYNYETDRIFAKITKKQVRALRKHVADHNLQKVIEDCFTSRDGFISDYDNDLKAWPKDAGAWDHNQVETLLIAAMYQHGVDDPRACHHWQVGSGNGEIGNCIYSVLPESKKTRA